MPVHPLGWRHVLVAATVVVAGQAAAVAKEPVRQEPVKATERQGGDNRAKADGDDKGFTLPGAQKNEPIHIDAAILEYDSRQNVAVFRGDVVTTQGDVVVHSALLRVMMADSGADDGSPGRAESVIAEGDVRILQGARVATGDRAEFKDADRTVVLSGDAVLQEGSNEVRGERVIVYLDEERSVVEGTNTRVKAILVPKDKSKKAEEQGPDAPAATGKRPREDPTDE
jgi:lipopolysaccharide export system protein LptA